MLLKKLVISKRGGLPVFEVLEKLCISDLDPLKCVRLYTDKGLTAGSRIAPGGGSCLSRLPTVLCRPTFLCSVAFSSFFQFQHSLICKEV